MSPLEENEVAAEASVALSGDVAKYLLSASGRR